MQAVPTLTVFVHGTVMWYLALTSPSWLMEGEVESGSWYETLLESRRNNPDLFEQKLMLEKGFREIPIALLHAAQAGHLSSSRKRCASYYLLAGYDTLSRAVGAHSEDDHYALFGWSGMNSQTARRKASLELYRSIADWSDDYSQKHQIKPLIKIAAYSHGGNVAFLLSEAEKNYQRGLRVKQLMLFATPIQTETARSILSDFFQSIILFRSPEGDEIQTMDTFSTALGESYAQMSDIVDLKRMKHRHPTLERVDVALWVNKDADAVNHFNFFELDAQPLHPLLAPLPVIVLAPALVHQLENHPEHSALRAFLVCSGASVKVRVKSWHDFYEAPLSESEELYATISTIKAFTRRYWKPQSEGFSMTIAKQYYQFTSWLDIFDDE